MKTPSLRVRVVAAGVSVVAAVLGAVDTFLYVSFRSSLRSDLESVLEERAVLIRNESAGRGPRQLAERLTELGIRATVQGADGRVYRAQPPSPVLGETLASDVGDVEGPALAMDVSLPAGTTVTVEAPRGGMDNTLRRLVVLELTGTAVGIALATLLLVRVTAVALGPLDEIAAMARRVAAGRRGERLRPDRPGTRMGQMAAAYDEMLDALEASLTEAREAEAHSRSMEERARQIVDTATDAFVAIDLQGAITAWNQGAERVFGWLEEEVLGRDAFETIFPPEQRDEHRHRLQQLRASGERRQRGRHLETVALRRDGSTFAVELVMWAVGEGPERSINAFVHDVSERRRTEEAVHRLAALVEASEDAILGMTLEGVITTWNPGAERIYGYRADEMVDQPIARIVPEDRRAELAGLLELVAEGFPVANREMVMFPQHGPPIDVAVTISPVRDVEGAVSGASVIARDISEQRWLATTLDDTLTRLESALEVARASEARSRRFLADAAHQLRTPIAGIRACAETLLRGADRVDRERLLADLVRETSRASRLMSSLLQIARLDQGGPLKLAWCDLGALCSDELDRARLLAPHLEFPLSVEGDGAAYADADAVREVLANLLDNARRYARSRVLVTVAHQGDAVEVLVTDDGPGVEPGMEERIFERFVSLDGKGGSGLGLPIARGLATASGGDLRYEGGAFALRLRATAPVDTTT